MENKAKGQKVLEYARIYKIKVQREEAQRAQEKMLGYTYIYIYEDQTWESNKHMLIPSEQFLPYLNILSAHHVS